MSGGRRFMTQGVVENRRPPGQWTEQANCKESNVDMYPEGNRIDEEVVYLALQVCDACAVRKDCLKYAIENGEIFGVWGGTTEFHRRRLMHEASTGKVSADKVVLRWEVKYAKTMAEVKAKVERRLLAMEKARQREIRIQTRRRQQELRQRPLDME